MIRPAVFTVCAALGAGVGISAVAQIKSDIDPYRRHGSTQVSEYRVGASITATQGAIRNVVAMVAVPLECDEQAVQVAAEDVTSHCKEVQYRLLREGGARQLLISIPYLPAGEEAHALITFEVRTSTILPPADTSDLRIPVKPDRALKRYLGRSPYIETNHGKI